MLYVDVIVLVIPTTDRDAVSVLCNVSQCAVMSADVNVMMSCQTGLTSEGALRG